MRPVPTEREDDRLVTEQTLNAVCEMKVEERRREAAIARPLAWGLKVARPVASRETSSLGVKGLPAPLMISLAVVFLAGCSKTWNRALFHGPPGPLASGPSSELGAQDRLRTRNKQAEDCVSQNSGGPVNAGASLTTAHRPGPDLEAARNLTPIPAVVPGALSSWRISQDH